MEHSTNTVAPDGGRSILGNISKGPRGRNLYELHSEKRLEESGMGESYGVP
jgi:hypothetical protein